MDSNDRRLIEDYLPLDVLNEIAGKEKKHPKHPVALIHYWPARRPTTASRAAIYAALVAAPESDEERSKEAAFISKLAILEPDDEILQEAKRRIREYNDGVSPKVLDMFAGGGAIPLEASRLGCDSHAIDYNPVAHLIELCTLVYPQTFGADLAQELDRWGDVLLERLKKEVSDLYPPVHLIESEEVGKQLSRFMAKDLQYGQEMEPVAYIWARTVPCRRPGCSSQVPLVRQAWLRKRGVAIASIPRIGKDGALTWEIVTGESASDIGAQVKQTGAGQAVCVACNTPAPSNYIKAMSIEGKMGESLAAVVVDGGRTKVYLPPTAAVLPNQEYYHARIETFLASSEIEPLEELMNTNDSTTIAGRGYGISQWQALFTSRQLLVLYALIKNIREVHKDMLESGIEADRAKALVTYLGMAFGRLSNSFSKFCRWQGQCQHTISAIGDRQALKMIYDFSEINPFARTAGCLPFALKNESYCIRRLAEVKNIATVTRGNAEKLYLESESFDAVITDPPYYSSIYYADLSAFFYVWLIRILGDLYPEAFTLPTPPKRREAVAQPSEHGGDSRKANDHYLKLMSHSLSEARRVLKPRAPLVCIYAHKTTEGWAVLIQALVDAGLTVTEAWPIQTEARGRTNALEAAALSDSIFFVARRREEADVGQYESEVKPELESIARERVATLWAGGTGIGGADLLMAAVGAGLKAYTRFSRVEFKNGEPLAAEDYLREVEGVVLEVMLEEIFNLKGPGVSSVDPITRFYVLWRFVYRESSIESGDVYVFCYPQGIEIDGPSGIRGPSPALLKKEYNRFMVRNYTQRGDNTELGIETDGRPAPVIDVLHRLLWLIDNEPAEVREFIDTAKPNLEQLRLIAEALCAPMHDKQKEKEMKLTNELSALAKLTANWRNVIEDGIYSQTKDKKADQLTMDFGEVNK